MATHSSILAWAKGPGRLQSMGSQSDMTEYACARTYTHARTHTHTRTHLRILISGNSNGWLLEESELSPSFSIEIFMKMHICMQHP